MRPVMFETAPASREDSRRALLDALGGCDVVVLLLGAEYGERTERGVSATEDEFNEAVRRGVPEVGGALGEAVKSPIYATGVGLALYGLSRQVAAATAPADVRGLRGRVRRVTGWFAEMF